jgi:putative transposase
MKSQFTRAFLRGVAPAADLSASRRRKREREVWQRRFFEHTVRDEADFERIMNYLHYNPVKHGLATCPHAWPYSSFAKWVRAKAYRADWCCCCRGRRFRVPDFGDAADLAGE